MADSDTPKARRSSPTIKSPSDLLLEAAKLKAERTTLQATVLSEKVAQNAQKVEQYKKTVQELQRIEQESQEMQSLINYLHQMESTSTQEVLMSQEELYKTVLSASQLNANIPVAQIPAIPPPIIESQASEVPSEKQLQFSYISQKNKGRITRKKLIILASIFLSFLLLLILLMNSGSQQEEPRRFKRPLPPTSYSDNDFLEK